MNFFLSICMQHTKMCQESGFGGGHFWYCVLQDRWRDRGLAPWTHWERTAPPDPQLLQAMTHGHCISCLRQDTTFIYALTTNLAHHSKFLKKRPGANNQDSASDQDSLLADLFIMKSGLESLLVILPVWISNYATPFSFVHWY